VGSTLAAFLGKGGHEVTLCDVIPELLKPALRPGIRVEGILRFQAPVSNTITSVDDLAKDPPDVIFLTVKANALPLIASAIQGFYREGIYVVSWQNGIDTERVLSRTLGKKAVIRAVVNYGCTLVKPGHVALKFHHTPHYIQELDRESKPAALAVAESLTESGLLTEHTDQIVSMVWRKTILNSAMSPVCAVTGLTMAQAIRDPIIFQIVKALIREGVNVARANEIPIGWDFYPYAIEYLKNAGDHRPSMLVDIESKRRTEIDSINAKIVEYGERAGVATPYNRTLWALVKGLEIK
jgi:2-dehydropantoate 2-reductase